ncbi:MAG: hypothetical protein ABIJ91_00795 [Candidatus Kuenenbacteria bacterium]
MQRFFSRLNFGDAYEFETRVIPAAIIVFPLTILAVSCEIAQGNWLNAIGLGSGLETFLAILFSKIAHVLGRKLEDQLKLEWDGLPTTRWLTSGNREHSEQQKARWQRFISELSGLDLTVGKEPSEEKKIIEDAILNVRNKIRNHTKFSLLKRQNINYGFARNAAGLRWLGLLTSTISTIISIILMLYGKILLGAFIVELVFLIASIAYCIVGKQHVKYTADRYAESFFTASEKILPLNN